jgi:hypothetical protein
MLAEKAPSNAPEWSVSDLAGALKRTLVNPGMQSRMQGKSRARRAATAFVRTTALAAALALLAGAASAQEASAPLPIVVSPSGYDRDDVGAEARARQERLLKRMEENDYLFRNICIQCGGGVNRPGAYAPFEPIDALGRRGVPEEG